MRVSKGTIRKYKRKPRLLNCCDCGLLLKDGGAVGRRICSACRAKRKAEKRGQRVSEADFYDDMGCEHCLAQLVTLAQFIKTRFPDGLKGQENISLCFFLCSKGSWVIGHNHARGHIEDESPIPALERNV